jgi:heat shock protein 4
VEEKPGDSPKPEGEAEKPAEPTDPAKDDEMKAETPEQPKTRQERRKVTVCTKIPHTVLTPSELTDDQIASFKKLENDMTAQDELVVATANAKNELETLVYAAGEKVSGVWKDFGSRAEKDAIEELAGQITIWLYDDGADVAKAEYDSRLKSLGALCDKLATRVREWEEVPAALENLLSTINGLRNEATSKDEKYAHIAAEEIQKVVTQCDDAQKYIDEKMPQYQARQKTNDPVFFTSDLKMRVDVCSFVDGFGFGFGLFGFGFSFGFWLWLLALVLFRF